MAAVEFRGRDLVVWFREHPSNGQEWQYRIRYECVNQSVTHFLNHTVFQDTDVDGMRIYRDALTYEENVSAGLTRNPKVYLATQEAGGKWSDEREIESNNPAPPVPPMMPMTGDNFAVFNFVKPEDSDWAGFVVWADTQNPVRKEFVTSKYIGPNTVVQLSLVPDNDYWITYAAYDAFGLDLLNEATIQMHTLPQDSFVLPILNERLEGIAALNVKSSTAFAKLANAYGLQTDRRVQKAVEKLYTDIDNGTLISGKMLELQSRLDDYDAVLNLIQETQAGVDFAQSQQLLLMGARFEDVEGAIVEERLVRVQEKSAYTLRLDQQASKIDDNESQFNDKIETLVDADGALSQRITDQSAVWNSDIDGKITAASQIINLHIADETGALSQRIDTLSAEMGEDGWASALQDERIVRAAGDQTSADAIITLTSRFDNQGGVTLEQKLSTFGSAIDGYGGSYTLRIDNNGIISGFGLVSNPNGNSEFAINADRFLVGHPGNLQQVFEVVGGIVRIKQAQIAHAEITNANIINLSINGDKFENKATYDFSGFFANLNGWHVTNAVNNQIGGSLNPTMVTLTTGNGDNEVLIQLNCTYSRDGGDDDNLDVCVQRSDGVILAQQHQDIQVASGRRTMAATFFDPTPNTNSTYTYTAMQRARGSDGSPYWFNVAFWGVCFKK